MMVSTVRILQGRITAVDFGSLYTECIEPKLLEDIARYECNELDSTAQRLFIHHVIHGVCTYILNSQTKTVIYFCRNCLTDTETFDKFNTIDLNKLFDKIGRVFETKLPVRWYDTTYTFDYFELCLKKGKDDGARILLDIEPLCNRDHTTFRFDKIKQYAKKSGLTFLDEKFFNQIKSKMLVMC